MKTMFLSALAACLALTTHAADPNAHWPQWRGPLGTGAAPDSRPPTEWSENKNVKWKVNLPGSANSTPIIWGDRIYLVTAATLPAETTSAAPAAAAPAAGAGTAAQTEERGPRRRGGPGGPGGGGGFRGEAPKGKVQFIVMALERGTGKVIWQKTAREAVPHEGHHRDGSFASSSPVTDGKHLYASFGSHGVYCYDLEGNLKWEKDLGDMHTRNAFGEGASPALHGDFLVINWDHEGEDFVVALDKATGEERWRQKRDEPTSWSTPLIVEHAGKAQVIVSATNRVRSYDLTTGKELWEVGGMTGNVVPTPVSAFGLVYAISGFRGAALLAIKLDSSGSLEGTEAIAWRHNKGTPYVPSPLLVGERLYFLSGNKALLSCFNAKTGKAYFEAERLTMLDGVYASPVAAGEHVYVLGRDGKMAVLKIADQVEVVATNSLEDRIDASPAIAGNEMFLRAHSALYCIGEK